MCIFEAFDEPWKGGNRPNEAEKHWGILNEDRTPKLVLKKWKNRIEIFLWRKEL